MSSSGRGHAGKAPARGHVRSGRRFSASLAEQNLYIATDEEETRWARGNDPRVPESTAQQGSAAESASSNANAHGRTQSLTEDHPKGFVCSICSKSFTRKYDLKRHTNDIHAGGMPFKCVGCGETLSGANVINHQCKHATGGPANDDDKNDPLEGPHSGPKKR